jgi:hypothetical protein
MKEYIIENGIDLNPNFSQHGNTQLPTEPILLQGNVIIKSGEENIPSTGQQIVNTDHDSAENVARDL